jgi:hypothetical protein
MRNCAPKDGPPQLLAEKNAGRRLSESGSRRLRAAALTEAQNRATNFIMVNRVSSRFIHCFLGPVYDNTGDLIMITRLIKKRNFLKFALHQARNRAEKGRILAFG